MSASLYLDYTGSDLWVEAADADAELERFVRTALGDAVAYGRGRWEFLWCVELTVAQLLDFFDACEAEPKIAFRDDGVETHLFVAIDDFNLAECFQAKFGVGWTTDARWAEIETQVAEAFDEDQDEDQSETD